MKTGLVHDHHNPHNDGCPQNDPLRLHMDCNCQIKEKRARKCSIINRAKVRQKLLAMANSFQSARSYTQVKPETLDSIESLLEAKLRDLAQNAPRKGKTI